MKQKQKKKRKHKHRRRADRYPIPRPDAPVNTLKRQIEEMNRLKPIFEAAKALAGRDRVRAMKSPSKGSEEE